MVDGSISQEDFVEPATAVIDFDRTIVLAVADGLGAHNCGDLASRSVLHGIAARVGMLQREVPIERILMDVNWDLYKQIEGLSQDRPMGASFAGIFLRRSQADVVSVGDCIIYAMIGGTGSRVFDPNREGGRTRVGDSFGGLRSYTPVKPLVRALAYADCRKYLIATDGLYDCVPESTILQWLCEPSDHSSLMRLWAEIRNAGAPDNVSMILVCI